MQTFHPRRHFESETLQNDDSRQLRAFPLRIHFSLGPWFYSIRREMMASCMKRKYLSVQFELLNNKECNNFPSTKANSIYHYFSPLSINLRPFHRILISTMANSLSSNYRKWNFNISCWDSWTQNYKFKWRLHVTRFTNWFLIDVINHVLNIQYNNLKYSKYWI